MQVITLHSPAGKYEHLHFNVKCVHKLHCAVVQCQFSSLAGCPHKQEASQSDFSFASYDSVHYIESVEHQVAVQQ